ncbi:MAG: ribosome biogenesis GTPase YlqF [Candidatus Sericytochromatia bacterium]|nr:ribosome biogenesis GTPase YlqF [Candidatus Sericytochromatia bacterium]
MSLINWYPGHIAKAQRELREKLKLTDFVLELVDARVPASSRFDVTRQLLGERPRIVVVTKADLADPASTQAWLRTFRVDGVASVVLNAQSGQGLAGLHKLMGEEAARVSAKMKARGRLPRASRVMVVGLPNVGKSSLINRLAKKRAAQVGDKPGVTRDIRWIRLGSTLELLDTPGIIPPKLEDQELALKLAMTGAVSTEAYDPILVAPAALDLLQRLAPATLATWASPTVEEFARVRGIVGSGGHLDEGRAARMFLQDLRTGVLGPMTLDAPPAKGGQPPPPPPAEEAPAHA